MADLTPISMWIPCDPWDPSFPISMHTSSRHSQTAMLVAILLSSTGERVITTKYPQQKQLEQAATEMAATGRIADKWRPAMWQWLRPAGAQTRRVHYPRGVGHMSSRSAPYGEIWTTHLTYGSWVWVCFSNRTTLCLRKKQDTKLLPITSLCTQ